ncbi:unnamed protein product [Echinostoma caproni]|uniref:TPH domain-containing protein n=1 Tax=Echinostoma caproni TaxID=27848 RepID=A0A183AI09_9TREM|nr:unnamed protein product [Echinostoma caproni]
MEKRRKYLTVRINGEPVCLQIDTACDITLISKRTWHALGRPPFNLTNRKALNVSGGPLRLIDEFREKPPKSVSHLDPWRKSRLADEQRCDQVARIREQKKCELRSRWEEETHAKLIEAETLRRFTAVKEKQRKAREQHREQLREQLRVEEEQFVAKQKSPVEEMRERYEESRRRAAQLEAERQAADRVRALEKYDQQFREGCDLLRAELSRRKAFEIAEDRKVQIAMKREQKRLEAEEEANWFAEQQQAQQRAQLEDASETKKQERAKFLAEQLQKQVQEKIKANELDKELKQKEKEDLIKLQKQLLEERIQQHQKKIEHRIKAREELNRCLLEKQTRITEELEKSRAYEQLLARQEETKAIAEADQQREAKKFSKRFKALKKSIDVSGGENKISVKNARHQRVVERQKLTSEINELIRKDKQKTAEDMEQHQNKLIEYRKALEGQIAYQHQRTADALKEAEREQQREQEMNETIQNLIDQLVNSEVDDPNRHPWRVLLAQGHPGIPQWTGSLISSAAPGESCD